jgi:hypothetical protein
VLSGHIISVILDAHHIYFLYFAGDLDPEKVHNSNGEAVHCTAFGAIRIFRAEESEKLSAWFRYENHDNRNID